MGPWTQVQEKHWERRCQKCGRVICAAARPPVDEVKRDSRWIEFVEYPSNTQLTLNRGRILGVESRDPLSRDCATSVLILNDGQTREVHGSHSEVVGKLRGDQC